MKRAFWFVFFSLLAIVVVLLAVWLVGGFARVGLDANVAMALILGILFSSLLGVGLMALIFYSDRSGQDDEAYRLAEADDPNEPSTDATLNVPPRQNNR